MRRLTRALALPRCTTISFYDEPKVYFMHIGGEGPTEKLAAGVKAALDKVKEVRATAPEPEKSFGKPFAPEKNAITGADIEAALGTKGQPKDGMFKVTIGRKATMPCGCEVGNEMGVNTWAGFAGTDKMRLSMATSWCSKASSNLCSSPCVKRVSTSLRSTTT